MTSKFVHSSIAALILMICITVFAQPAAAVLVDTELSLLIDVSGSVSSSEFETQRDGYVAAFKSDEFETAILNGPEQLIAVNLIYWSTSTVETIGWTLIDPYGLAAGSLTPDEFAALIALTTDPGVSAIGNLTDISGAIDAAVPLFASNSFDAALQVIDISGDGSDNVGVDPANSRDAAFAAGIDTINGIVIGTSRSLFTHYQNEVVGGVNPILLQVDNFSEFEQAIKTKLGAEINRPIPEPATMLLFGSGLFGLAGLRRRKKK